MSMKVEREITTKAIYKAASHSIKVAKLKKNQINWIFYL